MKTGVLPGVPCGHLTNDNRYIPVIGDNIPNAATMIVRFYLDRNENKDITLEDFKTHLYVLFKNCVQNPHKSMSLFVGSCVKQILDETDWDYIDRRIKKRKKNW